MIRDEIGNPPAKRDGAGMPMFKWRFEATLEVSATWVMDGYDLTPQRLQEMLEDAIGRELGYARDDEVKVSGLIRTAPDPRQIQITQGYLPVPDGKAWKTIRDAD